MTDFVDVPIIATGDWIDAAFLNQYWGDNFRAIFQGFAAAGDMPYAFDSNTIVPLNKPASIGLLQNDENGVPSYLIGGNAMQVLRKADDNLSIVFGDMDIAVLKKRLCIVYNNANLTLPTPNYTETAITYNSEETDADGWHSTGSNANRLTPLIAGYYDVQFSAYCGSGSGSIVLKKNNTTHLATDAVGAGGTINLFRKSVYMNGSTDYFNVYGFPVGGASLVLEYLAGISIYLSATFVGK